MSFSSVDCRNTSTIDEGILTNGHRLQMLVINTAPVQTFVIDDKTVRDIAVIGEPTHTMGAAISPAQEEYAVTIFVERPFPEPASVRGHFVFRLEPGEFRIC